MDGFTAEDFYQNVNFDDIFQGFDIGNIFEMFGFGGGPRTRGGRAGPQRGSDIYTEVPISLEEAFNGCEKEIKITRSELCPTCHGSKSKPGSDPETCQTCGGTGQVRQTQQSLFGMIQNITACPKCRGEGRIIRDKCPTCRGTGFTSSRKKVQVDVPAGIDDGQSIRIREKGEPGRNGGPRGDLLVQVAVAQHPTLQRDGMDIYSVANITFAQAALGGDVRIRTMDGEVIYTVKAGTQTNTRIRLRGKGVPSLRNKNIRGDQYVTLIVETPTRLNKEAQEALRAFDAACGNRPYDGEDEKSVKKRRFRDRMNDAEKNAP